MTVIAVTAEHIAKGVREDCGHCPVALALKDAFPHAAYISVSGLYALMEIGRDGIELEMPAEVQDFIHAFDSGQPVEPFTFAVGYPAVTP